MTYESDLEDWICENIASVVGRDDARLVGRQVRLANNGILDVLALEPCGVGRWRPVIIEVKRDVITPSAITQLLSYMGALGHAVDVRIPQDYERVFTDIRPSEVRPVHIDAPIGLLVAPAIRSDAALMVAGLLNHGAPLRYVRAVIDIHVDHDALFDEEWGVNDDESPCDLLASVLGHPLVWPEEGHG